MSLGVTVMSHDQVMASLWGHARVTFTSFVERMQSSETVGLSMATLRGCDVPGVTVMSSAEGTRWTNMMSWPWNSPSTPPGGQWPVDTSRVKAAK